MEKISMLIFNDELDFIQTYLTKNNVNHQINRHEKSGLPIVKMDNTPVNAMHLFHAGQEYLQGKIFPQSSSHSLPRY